MEQSVGIYQPFYKPALIERLDPGFIPLDWLANPAPPLRELEIHRHIAAQQLYQRHELTGLFSPKFFAKTKLRSQEVRDWIANNPGHDVYLINAAPYVPYVNYNFVERGNTVHGAGFESRLRSCCGDIGFDLPEEFSRQTNANQCNCNCWIASAAFWTDWTRDVVAPIFELIAGRPEAWGIGESRYVTSSPVARIVYIYERLVDYYVAQKKIDAIYFAWNAPDLLLLNYHPAIKAHMKAVLRRVDRMDAAGRWSDGDRAWLQERYAALDIPNAAQEILSFDPVDYDLPRFYPTAVPTK